MNKEEISYRLAAFKKRLADITPQKSRSEIYEATMLNADITKLSQMLENKTLEEEAELCKDTCMCGASMKGHSVWDGHQATSYYDHHKGRK